jgi:hypothetical protein
MPQLDFIIGNETIDLSASSFADSNFARFDFAQLRLVNDVLSGVLNEPVRALAANPLRAEFQASQDLAWDFQFGPAASLAVTLDAAASASIEIRQSGELFAFSGSLELDDDLPLDPPASPRVKPGMAYVSIRLQVSLDAAGAFGFTHGLLGIKANAGTGQRFLLAYHQQVTQDTPVHEAVRAAFRNFVFPYSANGAANIHEGCFSEWQHIGRIDAGFEVSAGLGGALLSARGASELARTLSSGVGKLALRIKPEFNLGVAFSVGYTHEDAFRTVLGASDAAHAELFLYKMKRDELNVGLALRAEVVLNARAQLGDGLGSLTRQAISRLLPADLPNRDELIQRLLDTLPAGDLQNAQEDIEDQINSFLANLDKLSVSASVSSARIREHQALLSYRFDRASGIGTGAFAAAIEGRLRDAAAAPGVEVLPGSFVRDTVIRRTTLRLRLFGALDAVSIDEYVRFGEMVYDGDGVFRLRYTRARRAETEVFGRRKQIEIMFTATAKSFLNGSVQQADLRLRFTITDSNNENAAWRTGSALAMILSGHTDDPMAERMRDAIEANPAITTRLTCTIAPSALENLTFTAFESNGRPRKLPHANDAANYKAFAQAVDSLFPEHLGGQGFPNAASRHGDWAQFNLAANDGPMSLLAGDSRPNRRRRGNPVPANWPQAGSLASAPVAQREFIAVCLEAARRFMNSCEDLVALSRDLNETETDEAFDRLLDSMDLLAREQLSGAFPLFFGKPVLAALIAQMRPASIQVQGPAEGLSPRREFAVKLDIA